LIINIHGFTGRGANSKYDWIKANLPERSIFAPDIDYSQTPPGQILDFLADRVREKATDLNNIAILGSSLGGFFGRCLNLIFPTVKTVLINPCLAPFISLRGYIDVKAYLALFASLAYQDDELPPEKSRLYVIIGDSDELIDHKILTTPLLPPNFPNLALIKGGVHRLVLTGQAHQYLKDYLSEL
jgi:predicted esterase YcpF (UPF0227 family)